MANEAVSFCSQCGQAVRPSEVVTLSGAAVCAACKPAYLRKLQEGVAAPGLRYKGFWIRAVEVIVDSACLSVPITPVMIYYFFFPTFHEILANQGRPVVPGLVPGWYWIELGSMLLTIAYNTLMLGRFGATLGDMVIGAKVVTAEGAPIGYGRALARSLMKIVSGLVLGIGYFMAAFDAKKRTLHDRVAGTVVVAKVA